MTLDALIIFSGTLVALLPYAGLPRSWDDVIMVILGTLIIWLGIVVRRRKHRPQRAPEAFVESTPHQHDGI